jgi:hypothetical protein
VQDAIRGFATFMIAYEGFGPAERTVMIAFKLDDLRDPIAWTKNVPTEPIRPSIAARIRYFLETAPATVQLLRRDAEQKDVVVVTGGKKTPAVVPTKKIQFLIRETDSPSLTLSDLASIIGDIETIFQTILKTSGAPTSDLIVVAMDSGSDKSIDVVGVASAVEKLSNFLLEVWDRVRFARANKLRASIKTVSEGLSVLNELKAAQEKKSITPEEAEKLKRNLLKSVDDLLNKGVYTSEMQESLPVKPTEIAFHRTKLITHYSEEKAHSSEESLERPDDEADGSVEEQG